MIKKLLKFSLVGVFAIAFFFGGSQQTFAATPAFAGTATMTSSNSASVTLTAPGVSLTKFAHSNEVMADVTDLAGIVFNGKTATSAITNSTNLVTLTFPISAGTYASGSLVIGAGVMSDTSGNISTTILPASITDNAPPQIVSILQEASSSISIGPRYNPMLINFSEPMKTDSVVFSSVPNFNNTISWLNNNSTISITHDIFSTDQTYTATISAGTDASSNHYPVSILPYMWTFLGTSTGYNIFTVPVVPTGISVSINNGAATSNSANVTLTLGAINAVSMRISNNPFFTDYGWVTYVSQKSWVLQSGDGSKTVYVKFISPDGLESAPISASIVVDSHFVEPVVPLPPVVPETPVVPVVPVTPVTPETPAYKFKYTLKLGSRGEEVVVLQKFLVDQGFLASTEGATDGIFGKATKKAVQAFQVKYKLTTKKGVADGIFGTKSREKVNELNSK